MHFKCLYVWCKEKVIFLSCLSPCLVSFFYFSTSLTSSSFSFFIWAKTWDSVFNTFWTVMYEDWRSYPLLSLLENLLFVYSIRFFNFFLFFPSPCSSYVAAAFFVFLYCHQFCCFFHLLLSFFFSFFVDLNYNFPAPFFINTQFFYCHNLLNCL